MPYFNLFRCGHNEKLSRRHREGRRSRRRQYNGTREHKADSALPSVNLLSTRVDYWAEMAV